MMRPPPTTQHAKKARPLPRVGRLPRLRLSQPPSLASTRLIACAISIDMTTVVMDLAARKTYCGTNSDNLGELVPWVTSGVILFAREECAISQPLRAAAPKMSPAATTA